MKHFSATTCLITFSLLFALPLKLLSVPPDEQEQAFLQMAEKTYLSLNHKDQDGNILWVCFNHMNGFQKENPGATGLRNDDMALQRKFPHLRGITLQGQPLTNAGFQVLAEFPQLEVASHPNPATHPEHKAGTLARPTAEHILPLQNCPDLVVLDLNAHPHLKVILNEWGNENDDNNLQGFYRIWTAGFAEKQ